MKEPQPRLEYRLMLVVVAIVITLFAVGASKGRAMEYQLLHQFVSFSTVK